ANRKPPIDAGRASRWLLAVKTCGGSRRILRPMNRSRRWDSGRAIRRNARTQGQRRAPHRRPGRSPVSSDLGERVVLEFAEAEDVGSGMKQVVRRLCEAGGADRVEWWCPTDAGRSFQLEVFAGDGHAPRMAVSAGGAGTLV